MEHQMITTRKAYGFAVLIVAIGVGAVEMTRNSARADELKAMSRIEAYSAARVDVAFGLVAAIPARAPVTVRMAQKGDLLVPPNCNGVTADTQDKCMEVAFETNSPLSVVVETRQGTTSTLLKLDPMTLAVVADQIPR
jgi:hypothetical protein